LTSVHLNGPLRSFEPKDKGNNPTTSVKGKWNSVSEVGALIAASLATTRLSC
jgi:hypothetical protein